MRKLRSGSRAKRPLLRKVRPLFFVGPLPCLRKDRLVKHVRKRLPFLRLRLKGTAGRRGRNERRGANEKSRRQKRPLLRSQKTFFGKKNRAAPRRRKPARLDLRRDLRRACSNHRRRRSLRAIEQNNKTLPVTAAAGGTARYRRYSLSAS